MNLGVAIVGCGAIGRKRASALAGHSLLVCADVDQRRAEQLATTYPGTRATSNWRDVLTWSGVDVVIVATTNDHLAEITLEAVRAGKHVLVEKPAARLSTELVPVLVACRKSGALVRVGFNHRYHPALRRALAMAKDGVIGELMFMRGRYGHGGRVGYDREWRADPDVSGGGELIDQGVHLIDLARCFLGEFEIVDGLAQTCFWDMPVDDNGFLLLRTREQKTAFLHVSCTEWKNLFSLEIYGKSGKLQIDGLGGSYGTEKLTHYRMLPEMGPPETSSWEFPRADESWSLEFLEFVEDIALTREPAAGIDDAVRALAIVEEIYKRSGYDHHA